MSTGGARALERILPMFPSETPPIVIVDHMPAGYTQEMARRMNGICGVSVSEARHDRVLARGCAVIAPGGRHHLHVVRSADELRTTLVEADPDSQPHVPSVDALFRSVARSVGRGAAAALMTGMGRDGAAGLLAVREAGGFTIAQDAATSVVYGMPRAAVELGAAMEEVPLDGIPARLLGNVPPERG